MKKNNKKEQVTDVKGTLIGFIAPDQAEQTQEEEIQSFKVKKEKEKELAKLSEEQQKKKRKEYEDDEERLEKIKMELIRSIKERIPAIEKKFKLVESTPKKANVVEKVKGKSQKKSQEKATNLEQNEKSDEIERE